MMIPFFVITEKRFVYRKSDPFGKEKPGHKYRAVLSRKTKSVVSTAGAAPCRINLRDQKRRPGRQQVFQAQV